MTARIATILIPVLASCSSEPSTKPADVALERIAYPDTRRTDSLRSDAAPAQDTRKSETSKPAPWTTTGALSIARGFYFTITTLQSGKVLVSGGHTTGNLAPLTATAEIYDPTSGTWTSTGALSGVRASACAVLLASGRVLVAGGSKSPGGLSTAEVYDPTTGKWTSTSQPMNAARDLPACAILPSGKVLIAGGLGTVNTSSTDTAEIYDPTTDTFTKTGSMGAPRYWHTATVLSSGKVVVIGGCLNGYPCNSTVASVEIYDPASGTWGAGPALPKAVFGHTATRLASGKVLVAGGCTSDTQCGPESKVGDASQQAYLFDPTAGTWAATGNLLSKQVGHSALLLDSGAVVVVAGSLGTRTASVAERYDPATGVWTAAPAPLADHGTYLGAARLQDGRWLVVGGLMPPAPPTYQSVAATEIFAE